MSPSARSRRAQQQALEQLCRGDAWQDDRDADDTELPEPEEPEPVNTLH